MQHNVISIGLPFISEFFYIQHQEFLRKALKLEKKTLKYYTNTFWKVTSSYGTSIPRWLIFSTLVVLFFGCIFSSFPCPNFVPNFIKNFLYSINPEISISNIKNHFSPFYYSIVTFTTLGYGDITPNNLAAQVYSVFEVFIGYVMLGVLLTVFSRKFIR